MALDCPGYAISSAFIEAVNQLLKPASRYGSAIIQLKPLQYFDALG
jgi:hypothetical protein